jgi:hypothetical protein
LQDKKNYNPIFFFGLLIIVQAVWILNSDGFYFIDDSCHFNYNRHFFSSYFASLGSWHRLGRVWLYTLPAQFGLKGVQIFASLIFLITIYFSYRILKFKNIPSSEWIVPVIGFQPVLFNISYSVLAELPAAFLIVLSLYLYLKEKPVGVMVVSSLIFMFRTEYYYAAGLFFLIYLFRKEWKALAFVLTGPVVWFLVSWVIQSDWWLFFYDLQMHARLPRITEGVDWYHYLYHSPAVFGFVQCLFFTIAIIILLIKKKISEYGLILIIIFLGILMQTMFAVKGMELSCSIGQLRYIAVLGPLVGIVSLVGLGQFYSVLKKWFFRLPFMILFFAVMFILGPYATPFHKKLELEKDCENISKLHDEKFKDYEVLSNLHQLANAMDEADIGGVKFQKLTIDNLNRYDKALIVWSRELEGSPFTEGNVTFDMLVKRNDIKLLETLSGRVNRNDDIPIYKHYDWNNKFRRDLIEYLVTDQYTWEDYQLKVFVKE